MTLSENSQRLSPIKSKIVASPAIHNQFKTNQKYPKVVIAAIIDEPALNEWGGTVAAPLFKRIAERVLPYLDIPPDTSNPQFLALK